MSVIVKIDPFSASIYNGGYCTTKYNGKKHRVLFKLICDDFSLVEGIKFAKANPKSVAMIDYQGLPTNPDFMNIGTDVGVYVGRLFELGNNISSTDVSSIVEDLPSGVVPVIHLPEDFVDLKRLYNLSKTYPTVRFCGGRLFAIDGLKIGAIGGDIISNMDSKYNNDNLFIDNQISVVDELDLDSVDLDFTTKAEKVRTVSDKGNKTQKPAAKKVTMFSNIFGGNEGVPL